MSKQSNNSKTSVRANPVEHFSRKALSFYPRLEECPVQISGADAKAMFDRSVAEVWIRPRDADMLPEYRSDPVIQKYAYTWDTWFRYIDARVVALIQGAHKNRLYAVWDAVLTHASKQPGANPGKMRKNKTRHLDFYYFAPPEVQEIEVACKVDPAKQFELRRTDEGYFYMNHFSTVSPRAKNK